MVLLDESLAISSELGMRPLMERVLVQALDPQGIATLCPRIASKNKSFWCPHFYNFRGLME